jgi:formate hydrogenlyase transcriptional activator
VSQMEFSRQRLCFVSELAQRISEGAAFEAVVRLLFRELRRLAPCDRLSIWFVHEDSGALIAGPVFPERHTRVATGFRESIGQGTAERRKIRIVADLTLPPQSSSARILAQEGLKSGIAAPIQSGERWLGVLWIHSRKRNTYSRELEPFLRLVAAQLAISLERARMVSRQSIDRTTRERLQHENESLRALVRAPELDSLIGDSAPWRKMLKKIELVANTGATVLIRGETGTGKELVARAIHRLSSRKDKPFVAINCGALSPDLIASELFGHERGAFTGAAQRKLGRIELAQGGTLFLDEIAELTSDLQVKLLRVLQEREFERVGGTQTFRADVRVIAATHRNLETERAEHRFRDDLYFRLNVIPIHVPPLRERKEDVEPLLNHFLSRFSQKMNKQFEGIDAASIEQCIIYHWPGNVRELENLVERSVILGSGPVLHLAPLTEAEELSSDPDVSLELNDVIARHLTKVLRISRGKIYGRAGAASILGVKPSTLQAKLKKHGVRYADEIQGG